VQQIGRGRRQWGVGRDVDVVTKRTGGPVRPDEPQRSPGDRWDAIAALYREQHDDMVRLATALTGQPSVAEELVHDAFVRVHAHLDGVRVPGAYLRTTVVNLARGHHRRVATARRHDERNRPAPLPDDLDLPADRSEVWLALQALPERRRIALTLRYYLDLPDDQIAEALGARPATVRSLVHRGLRQLHEVLTP